MPAPVAFQKHAAAVRVILYLALAIWSILLFAFTLIRLIYTTRRRDDDTLYGGDPFYEPPVVELLVSAVLGAGFAFLMLKTLKTRKDHETLARNWFEVAALAILWLLWLGGTASATARFSELNFCIAYGTCRILQALLAWSWLGWMAISVLFFPTLFVVCVRKSWDDQVFDTWGKRRDAESGSNRASVFLTDLRKRVSVVRKPAPKAESDDEEEDAKKVKKEKKTKEKSTTKEEEGIGSRFAFWRKGAAEKEKKKGETAPAARPYSVAETVDSTVERVDYAAMNPQMGTSAPSLPTKDSNHRIAPPREEATEVGERKSVTSKE